MGNYLVVKKGITMRFISATMIFSGVFVWTVSAIELDTSAMHKKLAISGSLEFEGAEFVQARSAGNSGNGNPTTSTTLGHIFYGDNIATLNMVSNPLENVKICASFEFRQYMTMLPVMSSVNHDQFFGQSYWNGFYIREGQVIFSFYKDKSMSWDLALGYMPYKYNPEARDLGEYLYRTGTYPLFEITEFDRSFARLTGLRSGVSFQGDQLSGNLDVFGLIERDIRPYNDVSIAAVGSINFAKVIDFGAGIDLAHLISMNSSLTTPPYPNPEQNGYVIYSGVDASGHPIGVDTGLYTFKGTKIMARLTVDPLGTIRGKNEIVDQIFGKSGGKIYSEYAIIGLKNYPKPNNDSINELNGYQKVSDRSPLMLGINIPSGPVLDVFSFELERWPGHFPDSYFNTVIEGFPTPTQIGASDTNYTAAVYNNRWNWSINMEKQLLKNFKLVGEVGRDHQRWEVNPAEAPFYDFGASLVKPHEWGWHLAAVFNF